MTTLARIVCCIAMLGATRAMAAASAQSVLVVVHPKDSAAKRAAQYVSSGFREALARESDRFVFGSQAALYADREIDVARLQREADALVQEGLSAYDNLEIEKAQRRFDDALALFEQNLGELESTKAAARVALLAAGAALVNNNEKLGRSLIGRALLYDANVQPDPRVYNSSMLSAFKDVRAKAAKAAKGSMAITTNPAYAELYVDGDFIGMTPDKIDRIDAGPHLVRVLRDGFRPYTEVVDVKAGRGDTTATLSLVAMPQQMQAQSVIEKAAAEITSASSPSASVLAARSRSLYVLVCTVAVNGDQVKVQAAVFHADNRRLGLHELAFSAQADTYREEARRLWEQLARDIARSAEAAPVASATPSAQTEERLLRGTRLKPIVTGVLFGVGGAAMLTGAIFGILAKVAEPEFRKLPQISSAVPAAQADLRTKAVVADVMIFTGLAVATAGALCLFLWDDRPANKTTFGGLQPELSVSSEGAFVGAHGTF